MSTRSLNAWLRMRSRSVWLAALATTVVPAVAFISWQSHSEQERVEAVLSQVASMSKTALLQNNRVAVESALQIASTHLNAPRISLIHDGKITLESILDPSAQPRFLFEKLSKELSGMPEYRLEVYLPRWKQWKLGLLLFFFGLVLLGTNMLAHWRTTKGVRLDVIGPVLDAMDIGSMPSNSEIRIEEVQRVIDKYHEKVDAILSLEATKSLLDKEATIGRMAAQISHGLKAPLGAIEMALSVQGLDELNSMRSRLEASFLRIHAMIDALKSSQTENMVQRRWSNLDVDELCAEVSTLATSRVRNTAESDR